MIVLTLILGVLTIPVGRQDVAADTRSVLQQANALFEKTENEEALAAYSKAIALDPKQPDYQVRTMPHARAADASQGCDRQLHRRLEERPGQRAGAPRTRPLSDQRAAGRQGAAGPAPGAKARRRPVRGGGSPVARVLRHRRFQEGGGGVRAVLPEREDRRQPGRVPCLAVHSRCCARDGRRTRTKSSSASHLTSKSSRPSPISTGCCCSRASRRKKRWPRRCRKTICSCRRWTTGVGVWHLVNGRQDRARECSKRPRPRPRSRADSDRSPPTTELQRMK